MHFLHEIAVFTGSAVLFGVLLLAIFLLFAAISGSSECDCLSGYDPLDDYGDEPAALQQAQPKTYTYAVALRGDGGLFLLPGVDGCPYVDKYLLTFADIEGKILAQFPTDDIISSVRQQPEAA